MCALQSYLSSYTLDEDANLYNRSSSILKALNRLFLARRQSVPASPGSLLCHAREELERSFTFSGEQSLTSYVEETFFQHRDSPVVAFAERVDHCAGLGPFIVAEKHMNGKGDIALMLFIFFFCLEKCVMRVTLETDVRAFYRDAVHRHLRQFGVQGEGAFFLFLVDFNNDETFRKSFIVRCLSGAGQVCKMFTHCKRHFASTFGVSLPESNVSEFLHIPYAHLCSSRVSSERDPVALANHHFARCEMLSRSDVDDVRGQHAKVCAIALERAFLNCYEATVIASAERVSVYGGCADRDFLRENPGVFCYFGKVCRFRGKDYVYPCRQKVLCGACGKVLNLFEAVEALGAYFCCEDRQKNVASCLVYRLSGMPTEARCFNMEDIWSLMRPAYDRDDVNMMVCDFMRKAFNSAETEWPLNAWIFDAYHELTGVSAACFGEEHMHFKAKLERCTSFDADRFHDMLVMHTFLVAVTYVCSVSVFLKEESLLKFVRSAVFRWFAKITAKVFAITRAKKSLTHSTRFEEDLFAYTGVDETFATMGNCLLGYSRAEHERNEKVVLALRSNALVSRFKAFCKWSRLSKLYRLVVDRERCLLSELLRGWRLLCLACEMARVKRLTKTLHRLKNYFHRRRVIDRARAALARAKQNATRARVFARLKLVAEIALEQAAKWRELLLRKRAIRTLRAWRSRVKLVKAVKKSEKNLNYKNSILAYRVFSEWKKLGKRRKLRTVVHCITFCGFVQKLRSARLLDDIRDHESRVARKSNLRSTSAPYFQLHSKPSRESPVGSFVVC